MHKKTLIVILSMISIALLYVLFNREVPVKVVYQLPNEALEIIPNIKQSTPLIHPDFVKAAYEPIIPEGINLALEGKVEVSSFVQAYNGRKVIDGKTGGASYWEAEAESYPNRLILDLKETHKIHTLKVMLNPSDLWGERNQTFQINYGDETGSMNELVVSTSYVFSPDTANEVLIEFTPVEARFVELIFTENTGAGGAQVAELEVYGE